MYAVTFTSWICSAEIQSAGFVGVYSTRENAELAIAVEQEKDMPHEVIDYEITECELDKTIA